MMVRWDAALLMTHCGDGMHCGINSSVSALRLRAHGKAQSCVCVCGLISKAPQDSLALWKLLVNQVNFPAWLLCCFYRATIRFRNIFSICEVLRWKWKLLLVEAALLVTLQEGAFSLKSDTCRFDVGTMLLWCKLTFMCLRLLASKDTRFVLFQEGDEHCIKETSITQK